MDAIGLTLVVAGVCFTLATAAVAMLIEWLISWLYP